MAERFIFFASAGFCIVIAFSLEKLLARFNISVQSVLKHKVAAGALLLVAAILIFMTISRNADWADDYTLYEEDVKKSATDARLYNYLGNELFTNELQKEQDPGAKKQIATEAVNNLEKSLAIFPNYSLAHANIANAFIFLQQYDSAEVHDKKAIALKPEELAPYNTLAAVFFNKGRYADALELCHKILAIKPNYSEIYGNMGTCYIFMKQYDSSIVYFRKAIASGRSNAAVYENIARAFMASGQVDSAQKYAAFIRH